MKTLKAIYNFIVGDMIILVGILIVAIASGLSATLMRWPRCAPPSAPF